jgi:hypothetical protein
MSEFDDYQRRRRMRPNAQLYIRHDVHRFMPPGSPLYVGEERTKYFFPEPERENADAERKYLEELESERDELLRLKSELAVIRADIRWQKAPRARKAYNPNQPRVPAGNPDGGQWTSGDGGGDADRRELVDDRPRQTELAQSGFGTLVVEIPRPGGRDCVYKFSFFSVIVRGPASFRCSPFAHWSAVTHGRRLNDN